MRSSIGVVVKLLACRAGVLRIEPGSCQEDFRGLVSIFCFQVVI